MKFGYGILVYIFIKLKNHNTIQLQRKINFTNTYLSIKIENITFNRFFERLYYKQNNE